MCGIAGYFGPNPPSEIAINTTLHLMENRGPDHQDYRSFNIGGKCALLLHSRLSIIDLDPRSNQPFTIGNTTIIYNGEIYNYLELRERLIDRGVELITQSDTEVLLHYYRLYGDDCVRHFEGMWAFAIFDSAVGSLFLSRDRFAEKPLYYINDQNSFYFASDIKFLKGLTGCSLTVNHRHVLRHLVHGYKALYKTDETFFEKVRELKYAQNLTLTPDKVEHPKRYWTPTCEIDESMSLEESIQGTQDILFESVRIRLRSDVPLAFCLSGGVDSAAIVSIAAKVFNSRLTTFSIIDSDERYNEEGNIRATANDIECPHHVIPVTQKGSLARLKELIEYHDAPIATTSYFVHSMLSEAVHNGGYKVAFSGTGADELFTGYYDHFILHLNEVRQHGDYDNYLNDWKKHIEPHVRNPILKEPNLYSDNPSYRDHVFDKSSELANYILSDFSDPFSEERFTEGLLRNRMMNELFHEVIPVILHEDDLNSMFYSIENRSPYLDSRLLKFAASIPPRHLIRKGFGKYLLRESTKGILNDQVRLDRQKKGFNASVNSVIDLKDENVRAYLLDPKAEIFSIINRSKIKEAFDQSPAPNYMSKFIFNFVNAKIFLETN